MKLLVLATTCIVPFLASAQLSAYRLADYKYRTTGFRALAFNGSSSGMYTSGTAPQKMFSLSPGLAYLQQYSTDETQYHFRVLPGIAFSTSGSTSPSPMPGQEDMKQSTTNFSANVAASLLRRDFREKYFIEYGADLTLGAMGSSNRMDPNPKTTGSNLGFSLTPTIGVGRGRLEYVSDAQMALYILKDLQQAGKIRGEVSPATVDAFARLITRVYNQRVFDFRRRRMFEMEKIDSFLRASKLLTTCDITTYNIINDNWSFAIQPQAVDAVQNFSSANPLEGLNNELISDRYNIKGMFGQMARYSGTQFYARLRPVISDSVINSKSDTSAGKTKQSYMRYGAGLHLGVDQQKPISLEWQVRRFASIGFDYTTFKSKSPSGFDQKYNNKGITLTGGLGFGYYPNSRTVVQGNGSVSLVKPLGMPGAPITINPTLGFSADYFVSYFSRLNGSLNMAYANYGNGGTFNLSYNVRYIFYFF